jgi:uncharacterized protein YkwD
VTYRRAPALIGVLVVGVLAFSLQAGAVKVSRLLAPVSRCPAQADGDAGAARQQAAMRCMHNYARRKAGRGMVAGSPKLADSAAAKARDILQCDQFSHSACGHDFLYWFEQLDYGLSGCWRAAENIAWGSGDYSGVRSIMRGWLRSPGHRANILGPYEQLGVGLRVGDLGGASDAHVWVTHFGSHC